MDRRKQWVNCLTNLYIIWFIDVERCWKEKLTMTYKWQEVEECHEPLLSEGTPKTKEVSSITVFLLDKKNLVSKGIHKNKNKTIQWNS